MKFDARSAKALKPGQHIIVDGCPGLRLVAAEATRSWIYRYKSPEDGRMRQIKIGSWPAMPLLDAAAHWQELRGQRESGTDPAIERRRERVQQAHDAGYTLADMVRDYAQGHLDRKREPKGAKAVRRRMERAIAGHETVIAAQVSRRFVFDLLEGMSGTPVAANSLRSEMAAAHTYALDAGRLPEEASNWWAQVNLRLRSQGALRAGQRKGKIKRVLTEREIRQLFRVELRLFSQQVQDFLTLQLWTCTRGGEICQMRADQITREPDGVWWTIQKATNKLRHHEAADDQRVPLVGRALEVVERLVKDRGEEGGWLFPSRRKDGSAWHVEQAYMQSKVHYRQPYSQSRPDHVRDRLTVTHWSPHDLRRTGRTLLAALGCPHEVGETILGHVLTGVAGVYNLHRYDAERRLWLTRLANHLQGCVDGEA